MSNQWYLHNSLIHRDRRRELASGEWERSFSCAHLRPLIICRGPVRLEAMSVFEEMGIRDYGILLSAKDSITYANALSPELRKSISSSRVHRVEDYSGASNEERTERIAEIVGIARDHGYDSIFAGYGFMAEDEEMVSAMEEAGLNFIGPCSDTIRKAGRKDLAKETALEVGVKVVPGVSTITIQTLLDLHGDRDSLHEIARHHELPVCEARMRECRTLEDLAAMLLDAACTRGVDLFPVSDLVRTLKHQVEKLFLENPDKRIRLKAVGGGGGKGQRILDAPSDYSGTESERLESALAPVESSLMEVLAEVKANAPGDNKNILAEVNIESVRHEEIQVVGNGLWCITMGGRDCSLQMNEQKLVELSVTREMLEAEISGTGLQDSPEALRRIETDLRILSDLESEAARFGLATGLDSVSTFESIVDGDEHYFMEMNTRVQVEHRVTELCYRLRFTNPEDEKESFEVESIVELMVLLAVHGKRLPEPERIPREKFALEVRLNASDDALKPHSGGVITYWSDAVEGEIRDDQGICLHNPDTNVFMKYHLTGAYDSNIALLLVTGESRAGAFDEMAELLRRTTLRGENLSTNLEFLYGLVNWLRGNDVQARPATSFVGHYLTVVGQLKKVANDLDIVHAWDSIGRATLKATGSEGEYRAVQDILQRKTSLLARVLKVMLGQPHYLSGWLAIHRNHFRMEGGRIEWQKNPVRLLSDLYHYLNMDDPELPALYTIWDHDRQLLTEALAFYEKLESGLGCSDWLELNDRLASRSLGDTFRDKVDDILAAHAGYQLGMDILKILPWAGMRSGYFDLKVLPDLSIEFPRFVQDPEIRTGSLQILSPPPVAAADEIMAPSGGMYYAREAPDREPFVTEGQHFEAGDPLFIVEVMKMFNKVLAPFPGTVEKVLVESEATIVKKGEVVLKVVPDDPVEADASQESEKILMEETRAFLKSLGSE